MTNSAPQPPAGWYPDPAGSDGDRYWDGIAWSQATRDKVLPPAVPVEREASLPHHQVPLTSAPDSRAAGFGRRAPGFIIDFVLVNFVSSMLLQLTGMADRLSGELNRWIDSVVRWTSAGGLDPVPMPSATLWSAALTSALIGIACFAIYRTVLLGTMSATLGQRIIGVRTVRLDAEDATRLGWGTAVVRGIAGAVLYQDLLIGLVNGIFAVATPKRQTLSDMISKTHVLSIR